MKRIISLMLAVLIACTCLPASFTAAAESGDEQTFILPPSLTVVETEAFAGDTKVRTLVIPNTVTTISSRAFQGCTGLTEVAIASRDITIADDAFDGCSRDIVFYAYSGSKAMIWAMAHGYVCEPLDDGSDYYARFDRLVSYSGFNPSMLFSGLFASRCVIVRTTTDDNRLPDISAYNPVDIFKSDSNLYYIQFSSEGEAEECHNMLVAMGHRAEPDCLGANSDIFAQSVTIAENWGTSDVMGFDDYAPFVSEHASGNVTIAVVDSGVSQSAWSGRFSPHAISLVGGSAYTDSARHGSKVASIMNDCLGENVSRVTLLPIKVVNSGSMYRTSVTIEGIKRAIELDADIINLSLGWDEKTEGKSNEIIWQINRANEKGIHVVVAAGNNSGPVKFPASCNGAIAVSALTYSSVTGYDVKSCTGSEIDYTAPGLYLSTSAYPNVDLAGDMKGVASTSFAAPQIAAALALIELDSTRSGNAISVLNSCCETAALIEDGLNSNQYGRGLPQLERLIETDIILKNMDDGPIPNHLWLGDTGSSFLLTWEVVPEYVDDKTVKITASDPAVVSLQCFGNTHALITAKDVGTATISVTNGDTIKQFDITVEQPVEEIVITGAQEQLIVGRSMQLAAAALPANANNKAITWSASNDAIAEVSDSGLVTAKTTGQVTITCAAQDGYGTTAHIDLEVIDIPDPTGISLTAKEKDVSSGTVTLEVGEALTLEASVQPEEADQKVYYNIFPQQGILQHDGNGVVTAIAPGTATIMATAAANAGVSTGISVTVVILPATVAVSAGKTTLDIGETTVVSGMVMPEDTTNKTITWISSNPAVAMVHSATGLVTAVAPGTAEITGIACNGRKASVSITVRQPITITFEANGGLSGETERTAYSGYAIGSLPEAVRTYWSFNGWYTSGGVKANAESVFTADTTLYAQWTGLPYNVSFDANAEEAECATTSVTARVGTKIGALPTATREGYAFKGWYTEPGEKQGTEVTSDYVHDTTDTLKLYAHWTAKPFTMTFNANGGKCGTSSKTGTVDSPIGVLPTPVKDYYTFIGWYTQASGGTQITEKYEQSTTNPITVYAHWKPNPYIMTFDANGGECSPKEISCLVDQAIGEVPVPTRACYTFAGWYIEGEEPIHVTAFYQQATTANVTVVARWTANPYTITFNANGGTCTMKSKTAYVDAAIGELPVPTRTGYRFLGWYTSTSYVQQVEANDVFTSDAGFTLHARWEAMPYTVTFDANGGECATPIRTGYVDSKLGTLPTPSRSYYLFKGWFTAASGGTQITADFSQNEAKNFTVYAQWTPMPYTINLHHNVGDAVSVRTGTVGVPIGTIDAQPRDYYTFKGWYTAASGGTEVLATYVHSTTEPLNLYAHWEPLPYTMQFNGNGGTVSQSAGQFKVDTPVGTLPTAERQYYAFDGWYTAATGGVKVTASFVHSTTEKIIVYAHWEPHTYTMYFNTNGGECATVTKTGKVDTAIGTLPEPRRDYYTFDGWYTAATGGEPVTTTWMQGTPTSVTAYAHWVLNPLSDWVLPEDVPENARVEETSWSYRIHIEDPASTMSDWIADGSYWKQTGSGSTYYATFPSGYSKNDTYYTTFAKAPYTASETETTRREVTNSDRTGWIYWHWMYTVAYAPGTGRTISSKEGKYNARGNQDSADGEVRNYQHFYAFTSSVDCEYLDKLYCCSRNERSYNCRSEIQKLPTFEADKVRTSGLGTDRFFRFEYRTSSYKDYTLTYKYYKDVSHASVNPEGEPNVTDVVQYVRYREK